MKITDDKISEKAQNYSNIIQKQTIECPRNCLNPGLYFGYVSGYKQALQDMQNKLIDKGLKIIKINGGIDE